MKKVSNAVKRINVTGMLIGIESDGLPFIITLERQHFLPLFTTHQKLRAAVALARGGSEVRVQQITDHDSFLESVQGIRLMVDPWITDEGNTRFTELLNDGTLSEN